MSSDVRLLSSSHWEIGVLPEVGASLVFGRVTGPAGTVDVLRPTPAAALGRVSRTASFPLIPWSNRIPQGLLTFGGRTWQLRRNSEDGTAEHGAVTDYPWRVSHASTDTIMMHLETAGLVGVNFPWQFAAELTYQVDGPDLIVNTTVANRDHEPFPVGFGHHPYFVRRQQPDGPVARLRLDATAMYPLTRGVATGPAGPLNARTDFRTEREVGDTTLDHCLTGFGDATARACITYDGLSLTMTADPAYSHLVVYIPRGREYFAVEPVTHANGAHALAERGIAGHGLLTLAPGEQWSATWRLRTSWA